MARPEKILKRGFSVTRTREGRLIRQTDDVDDGEVLVTQLSEGEIRSEVTKRRK